MIKWILRVLFRRNQTYVAEGGRGGINGAGGAGGIVIVRNGKPVYKKEANT